MTPDLDLLVDRMLGPAAALVAAIHDTDLTAAHAILGPLGGTDLRALAVALAALVPDDQALTVLLAWTRNGAISARQAAANRARLLETLAEHDAARRATPGCAA